MNYFMIIVPKMIGFLVLVIIGVLAARFGVIKKDALSSISGFLIKVVLPALTISLVVENQTTFSSLIQYSNVVIAQVAMYVILAVVGVVGSKLCRLQGTMKNVYRGCMVGGNYGFLVIPLIMALFAKEGGSCYIPICSVVDTTIVWTLGFVLFTQGVGQKEKPWKKIVLNPIFISILVALSITSFHVSVPGALMSVIDSVGSTSYSWGLIYLGCNLGFMDFRELLKYKSILFLSISKLLLVPFLVYRLISFFLPHMESLLLMLICAAPSMTTSCMIAGQYHLDEEYASAVVVTTTLLCMVTIPVLFLIVSF